MQTKNLKKEYSQKFEEALNFLNAEQREAVESIEGDI